MMQAIFHGVRGSVPVSGAAFSAYGGHTTCFEIRTPDVQVIIDAGSGFQNVRIAEEGPVILVFTHFHHDHIQGLAFNGDLLRLNREIFVTSGLCGPDLLKDHLQSYFHGAYFPIDLIALKHQLHFVEFNEIPEIFRGILDCQTMPLSHPGGCAAYRFGAGGSHVSTLFDNEFDPEQQDKLLDFVAESGLIVWDGMFLDEEMPMRRGWGHSSIEDGVNFFEKVRNVNGGSKMAITHHAPSRTDGQIDEFARTLLAPDVFFARENQQLSVTAR